MRWGRQRWSADEITVARELLAGGWQDAVSLGGGALEPRKAAKIASRYEGHGWAVSRQRLMSRRQWRASNPRELTKIARTQMYE